jgi:hypothetical protein
MLRRISYFILGVLLGFAATIFWASEAVGELTLSTYYCPTWPCTQAGTALSTDTSNGTINYNWGGGQVLNSGRSDYVSVKATGYITIPGTTGQTVTVYFASSADDGSQIIVDGTTVQNDWSGLHPEAFYSGTKQLVAGSTYSFTAWFSEWGGGAIWRIYWSVPGGPGNAQSWVLLDTTTYTSTTYSAPPQYSSSITNAQQTRKTSETAQRTGQSGNGIYIEQIGDNNNITIRQGITLTGKNRIELYANGNNNTLNLNQGYNTDGSIPNSEYNNHYQYLNLSGNSNNVTTKQITGGINLGHFMETTISGNSNTLNMTQQGVGSKTLFLNINGGSNAVTTNQKDSGQHYLDLSLIGNGHTVNAIQEGAGNHAATINFTNAGGASTLNLNQSGSSNQTYSINQSCANPSGCSTTITQP